MKTLKTFATIIGLSLGIDAHAQDSLKTDSNSFGYFFKNPDGLVVRKIDTTLKDTTYFEYNRKGLLTKKTHKWENGNINEYAYFYDSKGDKKKKKSSFYLADGTVKHNVVKF